jgi:hypothetical protein
MEEANAKRIYDFSNIIKGCTNLFSYETKSISQKRGLSLSLYTKLLLLRAFLNAEMPEASELLS